MEWKVRTQSLNTTALAPEVKSHSWCVVCAEGAYSAQSHLSNVFLTTFGETEKSAKSCLIKLFSFIEYINTSGRIHLCKTTYMYLS